MRSTHSPQAEGLRCEAGKLSRWSYLGAKFATGKLLLPRVEAYCDARASGGTYAPYRPCLSSCLVFRCGRLLLLSLCFSLSLSFFLSSLPWGSPKGPWDIGYSLAAGRFHGIYKISHEYLTACFIGRGGSCAQPWGCPLLC